MIQDFTNEVSELYMGCSNLNQKIDAILSTYQKLLNNPKNLPENDIIVFKHTIRVLLSDLATFISQLRIYTVHREINLAGKPQQMYKQNTKPLFQPESFNVLASAKNSTRELVCASSFRDANKLIISHSVAGRKKMYDIYIKDSEKTKRADVSNKPQEVSSYPSANNFKFNNEILSRSIMFPTIKSDSTTNQKSTTEENNANNYNIILKYCNMVPRSTETVYATTTAFTRNYINFGSKKRKFTLFLKKNVVA
ncbi:hypothetical protein BB561_005487 [Smittium simulii]|uniref:Uncharacterized protein n=1 Tax=Smittium simulii TaxID=133385 RepID=A0A2T9YA52_9FUNG|nr:hypothetical protein BB561_005487 [Smittium simulii]